MDRANSPIVKGGQNLFVGELRDDVEDIDDPQSMYIRKMDSVKPSPVESIDMTALPKMLDAIGGSLRVNLKKNQLFFGD